MAYDSVRAQLDKLLGPDRNGPLTAASTTATDYRHPDICKNYLLGFCPDDLHIKHRSEPGSCRRRHSDAAKAAFEKDVAASKASREKARWTASLLSECRAIVMDEDRKIRCHARRLKENYNAQGDLAGLMIQNFDTLKKLGMVSKDAKIRVLSEMDDDEFIGGPASSETVGQEKQFSLERTAVDESNNSSSPLDVEGQRAEPANGEKDQRPTDQRNLISNTSIDSESDGDIVKDDDGDDDDDFGLIKVIPAVANTTQEPDKPETSLPKENEHEVVQAHASAASTPEKSEVKDESDKRNTRIVVAAHADDDSGKNCAASTEKATEFQSVNQSAPAAAAADKHHESERRAGSAIRNHPSAKSKAAPEDMTNRSQHNKVSNDVPSDTVENTGGGPELTQHLPSMDEFYERGVGPDGLLMLDRKQSLRVCACCGGYISLVDAESRLLSHYGGKSHHSLAQLRKKVIELEREVPVEPVVMTEASRDHVPDRSEERERFWSNRNNERRLSREHYGKPSERYHDRHGSRNGSWSHDRRRVRSRRDGRGFGTAEWYNNYVHDNVDGRSSRRGEDRSTFDGNQSLKHSNGRKRYRSRSPTRDFRRSRRHY